MADVDVVIIGAGVVGLAIARQFARNQQSVVILEKDNTFGTQTSSRNSEVIHAGLYYPQNSLKAELCVKGKKLLYAFCEEYNVAHNPCGKLIVATHTDEIKAIETLYRNGHNNGCNDLQLLTKTETLDLEPELACVGALFSPSTGIINSHEYMLALGGDAEDNGAIIAYNAPFLNAISRKNEFIISVGGEEPTEITSSILINSAGLYAPLVAKSIQGLEQAHQPTAYYAKGSYFSLAGKNPFQRLIYPAPHTHGLGVHLTLDLAGQAKFGPDIEWVDTINYEVDEKRSQSFYAAIRKYWPELKDGALIPSYSGIRPKISGPNDLAMDFRIDGPETHNITGLINLFGIESPGLTASLAIANHVVSKPTMRG